MLHWGVAIVFLAGHCMGCWSQFSLNSPGRLPVWCLITPRIYVGLYCAEDRVSYFAMEFPTLRFVPGLLTSWLRIYLGLGVIAVFFTDFCFGFVFARTLIICYLIFPYCELNWTELCLPSLWDCRLTLQCRIQLGRSGHYRCHRLQQLNVGAHLHFLAVDPPWRLRPPLLVSSMLLNLKPQLPATRALLGLKHRTCKCWKEARRVG